MSWKKEVERRQKDLQEREFRAAYGNPFCSSCDRLERELIRKDRKILELEIQLHDLGKKK